MNVFETVNRRTLSTINTTLVLSALLSACGGGGGSSDGTTSAPVPSTTPTLSISSSHLTFNEDFAITQTIATATHATGLTVNQSTTGVVTVTTSASGVRISSIVNANGRTTLTITASNGAFNASTHVAVTVNAINDTPTLTVSTNNISTTGGFSPITIGTTASDTEDGVLTFAVQVSTTGVVRVTTSANAIVLNTISNASGQTTLTVRTTDSAGATAIQTIAVNVIIVPSTAIPTLSVSTALISVREDFMTSLVIRTTATDADGDAITLSVSSSTRLVDAVTSTLINGMSTITLTSVANLNGTATLIVRATDVGGQSTFTEIVVQVTAVNDAPTLTVSTTILTFAEDFAGFSTIATAIDVDGNALTLSVAESATGVVTVVTLASGVRVLSSANANGRTTLTITVNDGILDASTQVAVAVNAVNDTPTLTVSSRMVSLGTTPVVLTVSAYDVEDGILSFSVSTEQGFVNTAITTTSLTITQISNPTQVMATLTLRTNDPAGLTASTIVTVLPASPLLIITNGIKTLDFTWSAVSTATHYRLQSNPDGISGFVDLSTTGIVVSPNSTTISQTTAQVLVSLHRYIPRVSNPQYGVGTCDATSCGSSFRHNTVALTKAQLNSLIGRLQASNADVFNDFGDSVSLSGDGNTLAVGARNEDGSSTGVNGVQDDNIARFSGAVYVFRRNGGVWSQQAYIKASNAGASDSFGGSVSLSGDGNTLAVGAIGESGSLTGVNGAQNNNSAIDAGAVYVFRFGGGVWSQQAYIKASNTGGGDSFGGSVGLSRDGNTLAVGASNEDGSSAGVNGVQNDNNSTDTGAVYVFRFSGGVWSQQVYIKASNAGGDDGFGFSVSLSGDGNTLAVGAPREDGSSTGVNGAQNDNNSTDTGAVYVFRFGGDAWSQQAYIKASNTGRSDRFGWSASLSRDGNTLAVGAPREDSSSTGVNGTQDDNSATNAGAVYVFRFGGGVWSQQAYIKASNTGGGDSFGDSVGLSRDGNTLAVGAAGEDGSATGIGGNDDNGASNAGAAYVFEFSNGIWVQQAYIKARDSAIYFGIPVSLSSDGGSVAVGASGINNNTGAVYLY